LNGVDDAEALPGRRLDQSLPASGAGRGIIALTDVRFVAHCGLNSDFVRAAKSARNSYFQRANATPPKIDLR
jgi:hypothetical protein